jgi:hypothetical protein
MHPVKVRFSVRRRSGFAPRSLDPRPSQLFEEVGASTEEQLMIVASLIFSGCEASEAIQVHLPLKARQFALIEVSVRGVGERLLVF